MLTPQDSWSLPKSVLPFIIHWPIFPPIYFKIVKSLNIFLNFPHNIILENTFLSQESNILCATSSAKVHPTLGTYIMNPFLLTYALLPLLPTSCIPLCTAAAKWGTTVPLRAHWACIWNWLQYSMLMLVITFRVRKNQRYQVLNKLHATFGATCNPDLEGQYVIL